MPDLTIFHTNDLHGKLMDDAAGKISSEMMSAGDCLLLDSGDAVSSGNVYYRPGGEPILARMSDIGYDAMVMGNREFHFLKAGLRSKVRLARFPVLCANLRSRGPEIGPSIQPSVKLTIGDIRVAVFGLCVPMITERMLASRFSPYWFADPIEAAAEIVPVLRRECDLLLALTHIGLKADVELAAAVPGIDVVLGGHTHAVLPQPQWVGRTAVVQAGWWGRYLGKVEVSLPRTLDGQADIRGRLIDLHA